MNSQPLIGIAILGLSLLVDIIATAIPYWWRISGGGSSLNYGLFQLCASSSTASACAAYSSVPDYMRATQAMMILSIMALGASILLAILYAFVLKDKTFLAILAALGAFAGAGLAILGVIIFGSKFGDTQAVGGLHAGFGLAIVAAIIALPGAVIMIMARNRA